MSLKEKISEKLDLSKAAQFKLANSLQLTDQEISDKLAGFPIIPKNSLLIVNDQFRSTPTHKIIKLLRNIGKIKSPLTFIVATGSHTPPTQDIAMQILGAAKEDKIIYHDTSKNNECTFAGITTRGTKVFYNSALKEFDHIITIGSVEPHYFAGFTGGAKSIVPGIAALETITQNHRWAMKSQSKILVTNGNPTFEDIWEASNLAIPLDNVLSIQLVNDGPSILGISHGLLKEAFEKARKISQKIYLTNVSNKFDRIISFVESPLDKNLYQALKGMENTINVLKKNGSLVLVAACPEGLGSKFFEKLNTFGSPNNLLNTLSFEEYELGDHKIYNFAKYSQQAQIYYIGNLPTEVVPDSYMKKININELINLYKTWTNNNENILIDEAGGFMCYGVSSGI